MAIKNSLSESSPFLRVFLLLVFMLFGSIISIGLVMGVNEFTFHLPINFTAHLNQNSSSTYLIAAKIVQIASQLGLFIFPPMLLAYLISLHPKTYLNWPKRTNIPPILITVGITLLSIPFVNVLAQYNSQWHLPEAFSHIENWMRNAQAANDALLTLFLRDNSGWNLMANILMMTILPAVGEELLFRGVLQKEATRYFINPHVAIWITAIIFSAIHLQFMGFFSRAILGALFGYLYFYSNNLWLPILAHFLNNILALIMSMYFGETILGTEQVEVSYALATVSVILMLGAILGLRQFKDQLSSL